MVDVVVKEGCPAELIREYVEEIKDKQNYPDMIILSPECLKRLVNGYVDKRRYETTNRDGNTISRVRFIWLETEQFPAMEVVVEINEALIWEVVSVKEEASLEKPEFSWQRNEISNENRVYFVKKEKETRDGKVMSGADNIEEVMKGTEYLQEL